MSSFDSDLLAEFATESREHLADIEGQLLQIEADGPNFDVDLVNTVFRGIHFIKGAAGFMGLGKIGDLSHQLENVLDGMRQGQIEPNKDIIDIMLKASDRLTDLIEAIESSNDEDVSDHIARLESIQRGDTADSNDEESAEPESLIESEISSHKKVPDTKQVAVAPPAAPSTAVVTAPSASADTSVRSKSVYSIH